MAIGGLPGLITQGQPNPVSRLPPSLHSGNGQEAGLSTLLLGETWPLEMPTAAKFVAISLADQGNDVGVCWPATHSISIRTGLAGRTIRDAFQWLESNGYLTREYRIGHSTLYHIHPGNYRHPMLEGPRHKPPEGMAIGATTPAIAASTPAPAARITINNHQRTINEPKKVALAPVSLPDWLPLETWEDFKTHRKAIKAKMTPNAERLILKTLSGFKEAGHDPKECLERSIANGWRGVFAPNAQGSSARKLSAVEIVYAATGKHYPD